MSRVPHNNNAIFVWDCDANYNLVTQNNTHPIVLPQNTSNKIAKSGIENMLPEDLFVGFVKKIILSKGQQIIEFDGDRKKDFEEYVIARDNAADFENFRWLADAIQRIRDAVQ